MDATAGVIGTLLGATDRLFGELNERQMDVKTLRGCSRRGGGRSPRGTRSISRALSTVFYPNFGDATGLTTPRVKSRNS
jgi:hypothetical protein